MKWKPLTRCSTVGCVILHFPPTSGASFFRLIHGSECTGTKGCSLLQFRLECEQLEGFRVEESDLK